jgi:hypothetical protein
MHRVWSITLAHCTLSVRPVSDSIISPKWTRIYHGKPNLKLQKLATKSDPGPVRCGKSGESRRHGGKSLTISKLKRYDGFGFGPQRANGHSNLAQFPLIS